MDGRFFPIEKVAARAGGCAGTLLVPVDGGHLITHEAPETVAAAVARLADDTSTPTEHPTLATRPPRPADRDGGH